MSRNVAQSCQSLGQLSRLCPKRWHAVYWLDWEYRSPTPNGSQWIPMDPNGFQWIPMVFGAHGILYDFMMKIYENRFIIGIKYFPHAQVIYVT